MLVLTRRVGETIVIADNIRVTVVSVQGDRIRLGITAPEAVPVHRQEVHERSAAFDAPDPLVVTPPPRKWDQQRAYLERLIDRPES